MTSDRKASSVPAGFESAGTSSDITPSRPKELRIAGVELVLLRAEGRLFAIENRCPHQQRSAFHQAQVDGCVIRCPMHGWTFDLRTGDPVAGSGRLRTFEVRESGNAVYVRRPEEAATPQFGLWE